MSFRSGKTIILAALLTLVTTTLGQEVIGGTVETSPADEVSSLEVSLVNTVVRNNLYLITMSRMALQRSESANVKDLAQTIINHHTQTGEALIWIADRSGIAITGNRPSEVTEERGGVLDQLRSLEGAAFDEVYLRAVAEVHDTAAAALRRLPSVVTNPGMQFFVNSAVPIINSHLKTARDLMQ